MDPFFILAVLILFGFTFGAWETFKVLGIFAAWAALAATVTIGCWIFMGYTFLQIIS